MRAKLRMLIINSPGTRVTFVSFLAHFTLSCGVALLLLYLGMITSQAYSHFEAYPILEYLSKYRYVPKNERFDQLPQLNLLDASKAHRR